MPFPQKPPGRLSLVKNWGASSAPRASHSNCIMAKLSLHREKCLRLWQKQLWGTALLLYAWSGMRALHCSQLKCVSSVDSVCVFKRLEMTEDLRGYGLTQRKLPLPAGSVLRNLCYFDLPIKIKPTTQWKVWECDQHEQALCSCG